MAPQWAALSVVDAKRICAGCPVTDDCLVAALRLEHNSADGRWGIYGGTTPADRQRLADALAVECIAVGSHTEAAA